MKIPRPYMNVNTRSYKNYNKLLYDYNMCAINWASFVTETDVNNVTYLLS